MVSTSASDVTAVERDRGRCIPTRQTSVAPDVTVDLDQSPAELWYTIATAEGFQEQLIEAVRELLADADGARPLALYDAGVTALEGGYARLVADLDRPPETDGHRQALALTAQFGQGEITPLGFAPLDEVVDGPIALLEAVDMQPTIVVDAEGIRDRRRAHREQNCRLLAGLATTCDVRVVTGPITARWLAREHRDQLPVEFSEQATTRGEQHTPSETIVENALETLDVDGRAITLLRDLEADPSDTLALHEVQARHEVSKSRVSQVLGRLEELQLIERYGPRNARKVELRPAGKTVVVTMDAEQGRQTALEPEFSDTGNTHHRPCYPARSRRGEEGAAAPYRTRYLRRRDHVAAAGTAEEGVITAVCDTLPLTETPEDRHIRHVSYDRKRDEAVIAVRATSALQYMTSLALGLASPRFLDEALPTERLDDLEPPTPILRNARNIGGLSTEAANDGDVLRENLVEWGQDLADMTTELKNGEYEDRDRFRGEILRAAHGLAGTIVHLLDTAGVDVVRELRVPSGLTDETLAEIAQSVATSTVVQSRYGAFALYRQLFEHREHKREQAFSVDVDLADHVGEYIGGLVLRGPRADRVGRHVEGQLRDPAPLHEDAPVIAVQVPVRTVDRTDYAEAVTRMLDEKGLDPTRQAVTLFHALTASPYATTEAIHWLEGEVRPRDIRLDEIRMALSRLDSERLLPAAPPSVSKIVAALLRHTTPLSQAALADAADVSARSIRTYTDALAALDLIRHTEAGWQLALSIERSETVVPEPVADEYVAPQDLLFEVLIAITDPDTVTDPAVTDALTWPPDLMALCDAVPDLAPWIRLARALAAVGMANDPPSVTFGRPPEHNQAPLVETGGSTA